MKTVVDKKSRGVNDDTNMSLSHGWSLFGKVCQSGLFSQDKKSFVLGIWGYYWRTGARSSSRQEANEGDHQLDNYMMKRKEEWGNLTSNSAKKDDSRERNARHASSSYAILRTLRRRGHYILWLINYCFSIWRSSEIPLHLSIRKKWPESNCREAGAASWDTKYEHDDHQNKTAWHPFMSKHAHVCVRHHHHDRHS